MNNLETKSQLFEYYIEKKLLSYIYSDDLAREIELKDITKESWFIRVMELLVLENYEFEFFCSEAKENCHIMINKARFEAFDSHDYDTFELCNSLIRTLNKSKEENEDVFLKDWFIKTSLNMKKEAKAVNNEKVYFKKYFYWASQVSYYLLSDLTECPGELIKNEFSIHTIIDLCRNFPQVVKDDEISSKMYNIILANKKYKNVTGVDFSLLNRRAGKYLVKTINN